MVPRLPFKPVFIQTDNGLEFQSRFVKHASSLGLRYHYTHKSSPNENAVIERSFRTDEEEFYFYQMRPVKDYEDLRKQYSDYLHWYNNERPHLGINLKTPAEVVANVVGD
jgi:putative transposase